MFSFQLSYLPSAQSSISVSITGIITGIAIAIIGVIIIVFNRHGCRENIIARHLYEANEQQDVDYTIRYARDDKDAS